MAFYFSAWHLALQGALKNKWTRVMKMPTMPEHLQARVDILCERIERARLSAPRLSAPPLSAPALSAPAFRSQPSSDTSLLDDEPAKTYILEIL